MDYSVILSQLADLIKFSFPIALIFGLSAKMCNFALDMILNRRIDMQGVQKVIKVAFFVVLALAIIINVVAFVSEKVYKKKMSNFAEQNKNK